MALGDVVASPKFYLGDRTCRILPSNLLHICVGELGSTIADTLDISVSDNVTHVIRMCAYVQMLRVYTELVVT